MLIGGLGTPELVIIVLVLTIGVVPVVGIIALVMYFNKRQKSTEGMKKCAFCAYSIPAEAIVCRFCGREVGLSDRFGHRP